MVPLFLHLDFSPSIRFFSSTSTVNIQLGQFVKEKSFEIIFSRSVYGVTSHFEMTETPFLSCKWNRKSQLLFMFFSIVFALLKSHWQIRNKFLQFLLFESKLETCLILMKPTFRNVYQNSKAIQNTKGISTFE